MSNDAAKGGEAAVVRQCNSKLTCQAAPSCNSRLAGSGPHTTLDQSLPPPHSRRNLNL